MKCPKCGAQMRFSGIAVVPMIPARETYACECGTSVNQSVGSDDPAYQGAVAALVEVACEAEELIGLDELEEAARRP